MFNVLGEPIDGGESVVAERPHPRALSPMRDQQVVADVFHTGIKALDLLTPYP
jgi:F-type H+/Na+-transporting ATPase subunit beta